MNDGQNAVSVNYLALVLYRWKFVLASALACAMAGAASYLLLPKSYEASVMLLVFPPSFKTSTAVTAKSATEAGQEGPTAADAISEMMTQTLPIEAYRSIAVSRDLLQGVRTKAGLEDEDIEDIEEKCEVELTPLGSRSPQFGLQYSPTIELKTSWTSPEVAAAMAQAWAELFKQRVDKLNEEGLAETYGLIETMRSGAKEELESNEDALRTFSIEWDVDLMTERRKAKTLDLTTLESDLVTTEIELAQQRATLASLEEDLAEEAKKETLFRAPSDDVYWLRKPGDALDSKTGLMTEVLNENYLEARKMAIEASSLVKGLEEKKTNTEAKIAQVRQEIDRLDDEAVSKTVEQKRLARDVTTTERSYQTAAAALQKAKLASANKSSDIRIVGNAVVPGRSSSAGGIVQVAAAGLMGCLLGMAYVIVAHIVSTGEKNGAAGPRADAPA